MSKKLSIKDRAMLASQVHSSTTPSNVASDGHVAIKVKTGPGAFVAHLEKESEVFNQNQILQNELKTWSDVTPAKKLDSSLVVPSKWANRHRDSFDSKDFEELKADVKSAGGNVQAIKVRPILNSNPQKFEIVFGHRRHRACLELDLPVLAVIESISDHVLFAEMDRENRQRADLRPYEQGEMYRRALEEGLYESLRKLADAIGVPVSSVSAAVKIAKLPLEILDAFSSRLDIQYRWASPLTDVFVKTPDLVLSRAKSIVERNPAALSTPTSIYKSLMGLQINEDVNFIHKVNGDNGISFAVKKNGNKISFEIHDLTKEQVDLLQRVIAKALNP